MSTHKRPKLTPDAIPEGVDVNVYTTHMTRRAVTTAVITKIVGNKTHIYTGAAIKMPDDTFDVTLAARISIGRALKNYYENEPVLEPTVSTSKVTQQLYESQRNSDAVQPYFVMTKPYHGAKETGNELKGARKAQFVDPETGDPV